jgi:hypothetical protein
VKWYLSNEERECFLLPLYRNLSSEDHELQKEDARQMKQRIWKEKVEGLGL